MAEMETLLREFKPYPCEFCGDSINLAADDLRYTCPSCGASFGYALLSDDAVLGRHRRIPQGVRGWNLTQPRPYMPRAQRGEEQSSGPTSEEVASALGIAYRFMSDIPQSRRNRTWACQILGADKIYIGLVEEMRPTLKVRTHSEFLEHARRERLKRDRAMKKVARREARRARRVKREKESKLKAAFPSTDEFEVACLLGLEPPPLGWRP